ncbi:MAG: hypothetical protein JSW73_02185 [Candidatus Woesearchaeota archaeon]|nr:MAG: hypothetical protein JSW73_02185 [Candidatus Woesearchaeota archaeon]
MVYFSTLANLAMVLFIGSIIYLEIFERKLLKDNKSNEEIRKHFGFYILYLILTPIFIFTPLSVIYSEANSLTGLFMLLVYGLLGIFSLTHFERLKKVFKKKSYKK